MGEPRDFTHMFRLAVVTALATCRAWAQCGQNWSTAVGSVGALEWQGLAMATWSDGASTNLYIGGDFTGAGPVASPCLVRFDGGAFSPVVPTGSTTAGVGGPVLALASHDDGSGSSLFVGGSFGSAGGVAAANVARWNGTTFAPLGSGISGGWVRTLAVFDDGTGAALYAGGSFTTAGGVTCNSIAKWNGTSWSAVGGGLTSNASHGDVRALAVFDDGSGPALFAGGLFDSAGAVNTSNLARWNGSAWSSLGVGTNVAVNALATHDDGTGPALSAGGSFTSAGGIQARSVARWNATGWSAMGTPVASGSPVVRTPLSFNDGTSTRLYAGGDVAALDGAHLLSWNGTSWLTPPGALTLAHFPFAMAAFDDGRGPAFYTVGWQPSLTPFHAPCELSRVSAGVVTRVTGGVIGTIDALAVADFGAGPLLYAGGRFDNAGDSPAFGVASWDGRNWRPLGSGVGPYTQSNQAGVNCLVAFDDGSGLKLYAGGSFSTMGGVPAAGIARWNGASWSSVGGGFNGPVMSLAVYDSGSGPKLYAGGQFSIAGGVPAERMAVWTGDAWQPVGSGFSGASLWTTVSTMAVFDDGSGPELYVGGSFGVAGGVPALNIARWNGSSMSAVGSGIFSTSSIPAVRAMRVFDDGSGPGLHVAGGFQTAGGTPAARIARCATERGRAWVTAGTPPGLHRPRARSTPWRSTTTAAGPRFMPEAAQRRATTADSTTWPG